MLQKQKRTETAQRKFLEALERDDVFTQGAACKAAGVHRTTVLRWRRADPEFARKAESALEVTEQLQVQLVEDSLFVRIVNGTAAASETIFWLKNRAPDRWRDRYECTGPAGGPISHAHTVTLTDDERARRIEELLDRARERRKQGEGGDGGGAAA